YPPRVPPAAVGVLGAEGAHLHPPGGTVDEVALPHVQTDVSHRSAPVGKGQQISGPQPCQRSLHFYSSSCLVNAPPRQLDSVLAIGVLDQAGAVESLSVRAGSTELIWSAHGLG